MKKDFTKLLLGLMLALLPGLSWGQATLPVTTTTLDKSNLPAGFTATGLGTNYSTPQNPSLRLDDAGDNVVLYFSGVPNVLSYTLKANVGSGSYSGTFLVEESTDGSNWTTLRSISAISTTAAGSNFSDNPNTASRYIRWKLSVQTNGNVALANIALTTISCAAPSVGSASVANIGTTTADFSANVTNVGGNGPITSRGFQYGTSSTLASPTALNDPTTGTFTTGPYTVSATSLTPNTTYYYRGQAVNSCATPQTGYTATSGYPSFTTLPIPPTGLSATAITSTGFTANWTAPTQGAGFTYTVEVDDDINFGSIDQTVSGIASGTTQAAITGLNASTSYYFRVRTVNTASSFNSANSVVFGPVTTLAPAPSIAVTSYVNGSTAAFGNVTVNTNADQTFTITNSGTAALNISSIVVSGTGFSLQGAAPTTVAAGSNATFMVRFSPTAISGFSGSVVINTNATPAAYTINLSGTGAASATSDIVANASFTYPTSIAYQNYQATDIIGGSNDLEVGQLTIRDGGAAGNDADNAATTLSTLTLSLSNSANIRRVALYDGATEIAEVAGGATVSFTGLNALSAPDDGTKTFSIRVSFNSTVTDKQNFAFTVTAATVGTGSSAFAATNAGGAVTSTTGINNQINVVADRIVFTTQPASGSINTNLAAFTIKATDANGNVDLDAVNTIALTTSGTGFTSSSPYTLTAGSVSIADAKFSAAQTGITITATTTGLANSNTVTSSGFDISDIPYAGGDYRTTGSGNWVSNSATPAIWERLNSTTLIWEPSNSPAFNTANSIYIRNGNTITTSASFANSVKINVLGGGSFISQHNSTANTVHIYSGGYFEFTSNALQITTSFEIDDNGTFNYNYTANAGSGLTLWNGVENFHPNSNFVVSSAASASGNYFLPPSTSLTANTYNGVSAYFGNLKFLTGDVRTANTNLSGTTPYLTHSNLEFTLTSNQNLFYGSGTWVVGKNLVMNTGSTGNVTISTSAVTDNLNVKGDFINNSTGTFRVINNAGGVGTLNVDGNMLLNSGSLDVNGSTNGTGTVNLKGNLTVGATAGLTAGAATTATFNFAGTGDGLTPATTQTVNVANQSTAANIAYNINNGAYVKLSGNNLSLGNGSSLTVKSGAVLDFNGFNVAGTGAFVAASGSTLKVTSPDGINNSGATGNVTTTGTRTFNSGATYYYNGGAAQATGNGIPSSAANVIVSNASNVTLSQPQTVTGNVTFISGNINTTVANPLIIASSGTVTGGSAASYVNGPLQRNTASTTAAVFPVGNNGVYAPVTITPNAATATSYTVTFNNSFKTTPNSTLVTAPLQSVDASSYYDITRSTGGAAADIAIPYSAAVNGVTNTASLVVAHYNGASWESLGGVVTGDPTSGTVTATGVNTFSPFALGATTVQPLPVKLASFTIQQQSKSAILSWTLATTEGNEQVTLERSTDGQHFTALDTRSVEIALTVKQSYTDAAPAAGANRYRLAITGSNGHTMYSNILTAVFTQEGKLSIYPNPVADAVRIDWMGNEAAEITLHSVTGKLVYSTTVSGTHAEVPVGALPNGTYLLTWKQNGQVKHQQVQVAH